MTDFNWKPSIALQREWVEKKGLMVGDRVRILRKAIDFENDWMGVWCTKMDGYVGKVVNVLAIYSGDIIIGADGYRSLCPYFVLEKVTEAESPMYIPSTDQEPLAGVRKERKEVGITLKELAQELRKIFRFKYLTVSPDFCGCPAEIYCWTSIRPAYNAKGSMWIISQEGSQTIACSFEGRHLETSLDLSEYADEHGEVDYSKCILEVDDDQHMA